MATQNSVENRTYIASVDLNTSQHFFVGQAGALARKITVGAAANCIGVLQNEPQAGEHATVTVKGQTKVHAGGAVAVGNLIYSTGSGFAAVHSPGATVASGSVLTERAIMGRAVTAAASGSVFTIELDPRFTQVVSA